MKERKSIWIEKLAPGSKKKTIIKKFGNRASHVVPHHNVRGERGMGVCDEKEERERQIRETHPEVKRSEEMQTNR
jgi:hypothetical protein